MSHTASSTGPSAPTPGGSGRLGDRVVSRIGYGAMQLERLRADRGTAIALLRRAVDLGIDHVDTAEFYGAGLANELIARALRPHDGVTIVTKVGTDPDPGGPYPMRPAQRPEQLRASVMDNLRTLGLDHIPVVNLRRMDGRQSIPLGDDQVVGLDDQVGVMTDMRDEGLIGGFGLSNVTIDGLRRALPAGVVCVQNAYSLVARDDEDMLEVCAAEGIAWVPFFPLGSAFSGLPKVTDQPAVQAAAQALGVTASQIGLAWLLRHSPDVLLIPGTSSISHLEENAAVGDIIIDDATLAALEEVPSQPPGSIR